MKAGLILLASIMLFILVLTGVYTMMLVNQSKQFLWMEPFIPLVVLTGFFIFIISAGLFIYGLIKLLRE